MTFQRVPACTQLERLAKSGDKVVVCRPGRSPGRDSRKAQSRTSSNLNYRLNFETRQQRSVEWDAERLGLGHQLSVTLIRHGHGVPSGVHISIGMP